MSNPRIYVCAGPFIDAVKTEIATSGDPAVNVNPDRIDDVFYTKQLLKAGRDGVVDVFTSTVTISECRHLGEGYITESAKLLFRAILLSADPVQLIQPDVFICEDARDLTWKHNIARLRGADAIHIASAIAKQCSELITTDGPMMSRTLELAKLGVRVLRPHETTVLPDEYRQTEFTLKPKS
jgi:predicted nucleic acid-binding protein